MSNLEWRLHHRDEEQEVERQNAIALQRTQATNQLTAQQLKDQEFQTYVRQKHLEAQLRQQKVWKDLGITPSFLFQQLEIQQKFESFRKALHGASPIITEYELGGFLLTSQTDMRKGRPLVDISSVNSTQMYGEGGGESTYSYTFGNREQLVDALFLSASPSVTEHSDTAWITVSGEYRYHTFCKPERSLFERGYKSEIEGLFNQQYEIPFKNPIAVIRNELDNELVKGADKVISINSVKNNLHILRNGSLQRY